MNRRPLLMKRFKKPLMIALSLIGLVYLIGMIFYSGRFQANTLYAGSNISHMTLADAKQHIQKELSKNRLILLENDTEFGQIELSKLYPDFDPSVELDHALSEQDAFMWSRGLVQQNMILSDKLNDMPIDQEVLENELEIIGINQENRSSSQNASVEYNDEQGYYLQEEVVGTQLDMNALKQGIIDAVQNKESSLELSQYYIQPEITQANEAIVNKITQIKQLSDTQITYTMSGEEVTIPQTEIEKWIYFDEAGEALLDEASVWTYISELDAEYASLHQYRDFQSTLQGVVTIDPQIYGWTFDFETEVAALIAEIYAGETVKREPHYTGNIYTNDIKEKDDIGNSHVEIDLDHQMLYVYLDGELALSTEVVTGLPPLMETIPGAWNILYKETDAVLKGYNPQRDKDYATPVNYWVPFDWEGMGIHDASWQGTFGGDVWTYAGSNGCINIPTSVMPNLFDLVDTGMPVIIF